MANNEINISYYIYPVKRIKLSLPIRIKNFISATASANTFYRKFCKKNGIDLPLRRDIRWSLPEDFIVEHNRLEQLGASRDRIISAFYEKYIQKQSELEVALGAEQQKSLQQEAYVKTEEERLKNYVSDRKKTKDPQEIIYLDAKIKSQDSLVKNQKYIYNEQLAELARLASIDALNYENWNDQLKNIEDEIVDASYKFILRLGRKVTKKLSFSDFKYSKPDYSEKVLLIIQKSKPSDVHKSKFMKVK